MLRKKYKKAIKSKDGKVLIENFVYLTLLQITGYLLPLATLPYLAQVIGVDNFGKIAFAAVIIGWFNSLAEWGFNYTAARDVAQNRGNREKISEIFSNVFWARCFLALLGFLLLLILIYFIPRLHKISLLLIMSFIVIPGRILFPDWFFQAMERMKYITILNLISKIFFTCAVFIFIKDKEDFILQPLFIGVGYIVSGIIATYYILFRWKIVLRRPKLEEIKQIIVEGTDVFINDLMPNLYNNFSTFLLGVFGGGISTGKFDAGSKFVALSHQFLAVFSRTFYPFLSRKINKHSLYAKISLFFALIVSVMLFFGASVLIQFFFTEEFYDAIVVLRIMSVSIFFLSLNTVYGTNYLIIMGGEKELRNITFVCSIVGLSLSFPLIYYYRFIGAALTVTITRILLGSSVAFFARRQFIPNLNN